MSPDDFAVALADRLRGRGVSALPEDVRSFTADIGQRLTEAPDIDRWADLFTQTRRPPVAKPPPPRSWAGRGAAIGLLCSPVLMVAAGAVWGAHDRPAPCYGGGGPTMAEGAACGVMLSPVLFGIPAAVVSTVAGAVIGAHFRRRPPEGGLGWRICESHKRPRRMNGG